MGERGAISRYAYWSDRRVRDIASANDVLLERRASWKAKTAAIPFIGSFEFAQEARTLTRAEVARRIEAAIGDLAVEDFVTPPPAAFAKGLGTVEVAQLAGVGGGRQGVVMHTTTCTSAGERVDLCLFGSLENTADYIGGADQPPSGWSSSAAPAIARFIESRGTVNNSQWDDPQSLAVEALKIAVEQGITGRWAEHADKPWTRGFTLGQARESEWFAEIYSDVVLDQERWSFRADDGISPEVSRILVGAPLWLRTPGVQAATRYRDVRRALNGR
ncbi:hypothetical protein ACFWN2_06620 [Lentzea sp. NPDC058436]|uniref:hypothetical protein n=1 Tax=Lentzea sp. NPDC058436 TaxID=3346499 RepID=UPI00365D18F4